MKRMNKLRMTETVEKTSPRKKRRRKETISDSSGLRVSKELPKNSRLKIALQARLKPVMP